MTKQNPLIRENKQDGTAVGQADIVQSLQLSSCFHIFTVMDGNNEKDLLLSSQILSRRIGLRVTEEEHAKIVEQADISGMRLSTYLRELITEKSNFENEATSIVLLLEQIRDSLPNNDWGAMKERGKFEEAINSVYHYLDQISKQEPVTDLYLEVQESHRDLKKKLKKLGKALV